MGYFVKDLNELFTAKSLRGANYYMKCHFTRDRERLELIMDHHLYRSKAIVENFDINTTGLLPVSTNTTLSKEDSPQSHVELQEI